MKIVAISDTHNYHGELKIPKCDLLIHAGDYSMSGSFKETVKFLEWFYLQNAAHKILVAGNHDFYAEENHLLFKEECLDRGIIYLKDESTEIGGLKLYGTPWTVMYGDWAFMKPDDRLEQVYSQIPEGLDILISHCPPYGVMDYANARCGSRSLLERIVAVKPRSVVFGHIHEGYGKFALNGTLYANVSSLNETYGEINPITELEL